MNKNNSIFALLLLVSLFITSNVGAKNHKTETVSAPLEILFNQSLKENILDIWYPLFIDTVNGGYFSNATYDWKLMDKQPKMLVTQSRHLWTSSQAALFYHDSTFSKYARHGFEFLTQKMWDETYGGFFNIRSKTGGYTDEMYRNQKMAYGNSFAIYGLTSYYNLTKDSMALDFAKRTFLWLEKHSHDQVYGGYIDQMNQDGTWLSKVKSNSDKQSQQSAAWKDFNSSIHLMEAFTELYKVWPDPLMKTRLQEMFTLVRDTFTCDKGYLRLYFDESWTTISNRDSSEQFIRKNSAYDHISFGHDVETAFLLLEASYALGVENDTKTLQVAKKLVDHALNNGFNRECGGFYNEGYYFTGKDSITILSKNAEWWVQSEGLNALLMMSKIFPDETRYKESFLKVWNYIDNYLIDKEHGEWYINGLNYNAGVVKAPKASVWKCNYHNGRALMNCIKMLQNKNEVVEHFSKINL